MKKLILLLAVLSAVPASGGVQRAVALDFIRTALRRRNFKKALERLNRFGFTEDASSRTLRGRALYGCGRVAESLAESGRALRTDPGYLPAVRLRIRILLRLRRYRESYPLLKLLLRLCPEDPRVLSQFARTCSGLRRFKEALLFCRKAVRRRADCWNCFRMGSILEKTGCYRKALLWYGRALSSGFQPRGGRSRLLGRVFWKQAMLLKRLGKIEGALRLFLFIRSRYRNTFYGRAAEVQAGSLRRLQRLLKRRRTGDSGHGGLGK